MNRASLKAVAVTVLCSSLALAALPASAVEYRVTDLGALGDSDWITFATGLNSSGQVVGYSFDKFLDNTPNNYHAFVTGAAGQGITALGALSGDQGSQARAINDAGQVVGFSARGTVNTAFITGTTDRTLRPLDLTGTSTANGINASGQVVGTANGKAYITAANGGAVTMLNTSAYGSDAEFSVATGVNNAGQVVGNLAVYWEQRGGPGIVTGPNGTNVQTIGGRNVAEDNVGRFSPLMRPRAINDRGQMVGSYDENGSSAFLKNADGSDIALDVLLAPHFVPGTVGPSGMNRPNTYTYADDVNNRGQVVGQISVRSVSGTGDYAFITGEDGTNLLEVDSLSFVNLSAARDFHFTSATGINDAGDFVANASNGHAYFVSVVPEPASLMLLLAGLGVVGWAGRKGAAVRVANPAQS